MKINTKKTFRTVFYLLSTIVLLFSIGCPGASSGTTTADNSASDVKIIPSAVFSTTDVQAVINAQSVINRSINRASGGGILEANTVGKLLMPLFTGIKQNTTNYELTEESDGSFTIKDHFGYYMNHPVLLNVKSSNTGTVIKYYQDVDDNLQKSEGDNNVGTVTANYYAADVSANGSWTFSQVLADQLGTYRFKLDGTGSYGASTFIGSGSFSIETIIGSSTDGYTGSADTEWTQSGNYKRVFVRNGKINPKSTTLPFFKVTSLDITTEIELTTNVVKVTENNITEEYLNENSINKRIVTTKSIISTNDTDGNVISSTYDISVIEYDSKGTYQDTSDDTIIVAEKTYEGTINPSVTTTTNPDITTTTNPNVTTTNSSTTTTTLPTDTFNGIQWTGETPLSFTYDFDGGVHYVCYTYDNAGKINAKVKKINNTTNAWEDVGGTIFNSTISLETISMDVFSGVPYVAFTATPAGTQYGYIRKWDGTAWVEIPAIAASGKTNFIDPNDNIGYNSTDKVSIAAYGTDKVAVAYCADIYYVYVNFWDGTTWTTSYMNYWYQKDPQLMYIKSGMINYFYLVSHTDPTANTSSKYVIALVLQGGTTSWNKVSGNSAYSVDSSPVANCPSYLAIDSNGLYYSAYTDDETSYEIIVKKCIGDGTQWTQVPSGATTGKLGLSPSILLDGTTPYIAFRGSSTYNYVSVIKYDASIPMWNDFGTLFPASETTDTKISQDTSYIYIAYVDDANKFKISRIAK